MTIRFRIPSDLTIWTDKTNMVTLDTFPETLGAALQLVWTLYPGLRDRILDERGQVRDYVCIYVTADGFAGNVRDMDMPLAGDEEIAIKKGLGPRPSSVCLPGN